MAEIGVQPYENIGIYSQNMDKYLIADFAVCQQGCHGAHVCHFIAHAAQLHSERCKDSLSACW